MIAEVNISQSSCETAEIIEANKCGGHRTCVRMDTVELDL